MYYELFLKNGLIIRKIIFLPHANFEKINLWLQDFKYVAEYDSNLYRITFQLKLCGENNIDKQILEHILSIFHQ